MTIKIKATTEAEAVSEAKKQSANHAKPIFLFYCIRGKEYSISEIQTPYAPIMAGGYVPQLIAAFMKGEVFE